MHALLTSTIVVASALATACGSSNSATDGHSTAKSVGATQATTAPPPLGATDDQQAWTIAVCRALTGWERRTNNAQGDIPGVIESLGPRLWPTARRVLLTSAQANSAFLRGISGLPTERIRAGAARRAWLRKRAASITALTNRALAMVEGSNPSGNRHAAFIAADQAVRLVLPPVNHLDGQFSDWMRAGEPVRGHRGSKALGVAFVKLPECRPVRFNP